MTPKIGLHASWQLLFTASALRGMREPLVELQRWLAVVELALVPDIAASSGRSMTT